MPTITGTEIKSIIIVRYLSEYFRSLYCLTHKHSKGYTLMAKSTENSIPYCMLLVNELLYCNLLFDVASNANSMEQKDETQYIQRILEGDTEYFSVFLDRS